MESVREMYTVAEHLEDYNVALTEDEKAAIKAAAEKFMSDNDKAALAEMGATQEIVEEMLTLYTERQKMYEAIISEVDTNVTFNVSGLNITYEGEPTVIKGNLYPTMYMNNTDNIIHNFSLVTTSNIEIHSKISLEIITLPDELKHESFRWNLYKDSTQISSGSFQNWPCSAAPRTGKRCTGRTRHPDADSCGSGARSVP